MDKVKVSRVENVLLQRDSTCQSGVLHLAQHHLMFQAVDGDPKEYKIPYSLLARVTRQPSLLPLNGRKSQTAPLAKQGRIYPLIIRLRTFECSVALGFQSESKATEVFESLKAVAILPSIDLIHAFFFKPDPPFSYSEGWSVYDFRTEMSRQGVGIRTKAWRLTDLNTQYEFCPTYPALMAIPARISDTTLQHAAKYRSKARVPALSYLHWGNNASITRCAQPLPGLKQARSVQDEKVVEAIFSSHLTVDQMANSSAAAVYGATTTNLIVDARPRTNAMATYARGGGTENMDHYKGCRRDYLGIENIHVMRDSINHVVEALRAADDLTTFGMEVKVEAAEEDEIPEPQYLADEMSRSASSASGAGVAGPSKTRLAPGQQPLDIGALKRSNWLRHLGCLLEGTATITRNVHIASSHVMVHCSDGWDRTSQLSALAQLCLDPYFRTKKGFAVLVEKEWLSFGHRFADRCGHGGSEKYFVTAAGHGESSEEEESDEAEGSFPAGAQAAANAFWGFTKQITSNFGGGNGGATPGATAHGPGAHVKETSPVFTQFLDCVWQILRQNPSRFEFNDVWLSTLHRELYECRFGTFLANCERERKQAPEGGRYVIVKDTQSVWNYLLAEENATKFNNTSFDAALDDPKRPDADMGVLLVKGTDVKWWPGLFGTRVEEANRAIEFEESERLRRKAEKARWDEERALERARKEEEEKKRLAELREQQRVMAGDPSSQSSRISTMSEKGAVDLFTASQIRGTNGQAEVDPARLAYKPRAPKTRMAGTAPEKLQSTADSHSQHPDPPNPTLAPPLQASDAATRLKSWALGGWDRFQEALAVPSPNEQAGHHQAWSPASGQRETAAHNNVARGRIPSSEADNPWATPSTSGRRSDPRHFNTTAPALHAQNRATPMPSTDGLPTASSDSRVSSNPWRSESGSNVQSSRSSSASRRPPDSFNSAGPHRSDLDGLPNTLDRMYLHGETNDGAPTGTRNSSRERGEGVQQKPASQRPVPKEEDEKLSASFDPLGVGL